MMSQKTLQSLLTDKDGVIFEAASTSIANTIGKEFCHPVHSYDQSDNCKLYSIVVKENRRWFWQSPKYTPSEFDLSQIVEDKDIQSKLEDLEVETTIAKEMKNSYSYDDSGKIGGKLGLIFKHGAEWSNDDKVVLETDVKNLKKQEAHTSDLMNLVESLKIDLLNDFVQQVNQNPECVLCLTYATWSTTEDTTVTLKKSESDKVGVDLPLGGIGINMELEHKETGAGEQSITIAKDVTLVYKSYDLLVYDNGSMKLVVENAQNGGFITGEENDESLFKEMADLFPGIHSLPYNDKVIYRQHVLGVCKCPSDVDYLLVIIKRGHDSCQQKKSVTDKELNDLFQNIKMKDDALAILIAIGFTMQEKVLSCPVTMTELLDSTRCLFEALIEVNDTATKLLRDLDTKGASALFYVLLRLVHGLEVSTSERQAEILCRTTPQAITVKDILQSMNVVLDVANQDLNADKAGRYDMQGVLRVVYALWMDKGSAIQLLKMISERQNGFNCCFCTCF